MLILVDELACICRFPSQFSAYTTCSMDAMSLSLKRYPNLLSAGGRALYQFQKYNQQSYITLFCMYTNISDVIDH
mgnify:CR=1 FL=1